MSIRFPSEIIVEQFVPTIRAMLATELESHDLTQQEIANQLGVTQAAVSNYAGGGVTVEPRLADNPRTTAVVEDVAAGLATGQMDHYEVLAELLTLVEEFEDRGPICELHEEAMPSLQGTGCDLCVRGVDEALQAERAVLLNVREAARVLETTPGLAAHVPNVGTNAGTALPDATAATDVAAVPGRIYAIGGRVKVPGNPEFGASKHVAEAVLAAMAVDPEVRGAVNVATDERLLDTAREHGLEPLEIDASYENRRERLRERFRERGSVPQVVYHRGAFGVEPITYMYGATALDAASLLADLVRTE